MFVRKIFRYWIILPACLIQLSSACQTVKERSDKAYAGLSGSSGTTRVRLLNELVSYRLTDSTDKAARLARIAVSEAGEIKDNSLLARSWVALGSVYLTKKMPDSAKYALYQAGRLFTKYSMTEGKDFYYLTRGRLLLMQNREVDAIAEFRDAVPLAEKRSDYVTLGLIYKQLAACYKQLNRPKELISSLDKASFYFRKGGDPFILGPQQMGLGILYLDMGLEEKASEQFIMAEKASETASDSISLGYLYSNIAGIYYSHACRQKAEEYYENSMKIFRATRHYQGMAYCLNQMGMGYFNENQYKKALPLLSRAAMLKNESSDWQGACFVYSNLVEVYIRLNKRNEATSAIKTASEMCIRAGDKLSMAAFMQANGSYHTYLREYDKALGYYQRSIQLARELNVQGIVMEDLRAISEMYQLKGDAGGALEYYKKYTTIKDSLAKASDFKALADLRMKYETEKKDRQLKTLLTRLKYGKERYVFLVNGIIIAVLLIIFTILFFRMRGNYSGSKQRLPALRKQTTAGPRIEATPAPLMLPAEKASKKVLTGEMQSGLWIRLQELMEREKLYLRNDLTLSELARKLNTNTTYLSKVINDITQQNFSNYLNNFRIDEACRLLSGPHGRNLTIEGIAQSVGFNSKSAFNAAFKKIKYVTPSEYLSREQNAAVRQSLEKNPVS